MYVNTSKIPKGHQINVCKYVQDTKKLPKVNKL